MKQQLWLPVSRSTCWGGIFDLENSIRRLEELNSLAEDPNLWSDQKKAQLIMKERRQLDGALNDYNQIANGLADQIGMIELAEAEGDAALVKEAEQAILALRDRAAAKELESLLSGEADHNDCYLEVNSGAGGTEAQDWAEMLLRMYLRWAEQHNYKVEYLEESPGDGAGIKSGTILISGLNAYGWLKSESGVHRLVRISPYDANARRHTSFASVYVTPVIDDTIDIVVNDSDIKVDTYRASGAGGQHVNRTDSAVRFTHIPTGIVVSCQQNRSQIQNRARCLEMLKARLYEMELQKREAAANVAEAAKTDNSWGHQIRSYVLHPYQMVKDVRTEAETTQAARVLDGDLDLFLQASLAARVKDKA